MAATAEKKPFTAVSFAGYLNEKKLMGSNCPHCDKNFLPPRALCPSCYSDQLDWVEFTSKAKLVAFTSIYIAPTAMIEAGYGRDKPYLAGIVELENGVRISAQILGVDPSQPDTSLIGKPVTTEFVERGEGEVRQTYLAFRVEE
jgi:uncharacterized OB-fold protein